MQPDETRVAACGHDPSDISFDRSICACGSMHYFCNVCGAQTDACHDEPAPAAAPVNGFSDTTNFGPAAYRPGVGRRMDSRDVQIARERFEDALKVYANALAWWNAPDHLHSRAQIRSMVEELLEEELPDGTSAGWRFMRDVVRSNVDRAAAEKGTLTWFDVPRGGGLRGGERGHRSGRFAR